MNFDLFAQPEAPKPAPDLPTVRTYHLQACRACGAHYLPVDWLPWRVDGYCCEKCVPKEDGTRA